MTREVQKGKKSLVGWGPGAETPTISRAKGLLCSSDCHAPLRATWVLPSSQWDSLHYNPHRSPLIMCFFSHERYQDASFTCYLRSVTSHKRIWKPIMTPKILYFSSSQMWRYKGVAGLVCRRSQIHSSMSKERFFSS